jgi:hypothetical protein
MRLVDELGYKTIGYHKLKLVGGLLQIIDIKTNNIIGSHDVYITPIGRREIPSTKIKEELSTMHGSVSVRLMPEVGFIEASHGQTILSAKSIKQNYLLTIQPGA